MKEKFLRFSEIIDSLRVVPRLFLIVYGVLVYKLYTWYTSIETTVVTTCNEALIEVLLKHGENLQQAQELACSVTSVIGGPTTEQTAFVTTIIGLSTAIFAFYTNTSRLWKNKEKDDSNPSGG